MYQMDKILTATLSAVNAAGEAITHLQTQDYSIQYKHNRELLTQADLQANTILNEQLTYCIPQAGWLSEETQDNEKRLHCEYVWIVDPIDGTREFVQGLPEYAISVALVERGRVILGVVYNPAQKKMYHALAGQGAWCNHNRVQCSALSNGKLSILASRNEFERGEWTVFQDKATINPVGSIAYKLALVASGEADATFSLDNKNEWDIAAGVLLVHEAGGISNANPHLGGFNKKNPLVDNIIASSANSWDMLCSLIENERS